jgi:hypothetical protein
MQGRLRICKAAVNVVQLIQLGSSYMRLGFFIVDARPTVISKHVWSKWRGIAEDPWRIVK